MFKLFITSNLLFSINTNLAKENTSAFDRHQRIVWCYDVSRNPMAFPPQVGARPLGRPNSRLQLKGKERKYNPAARDRGIPRRRSTMGAKLGWISGHEWCHSRQLGMDNPNGRVCRGSRVQRQISCCSSQLARKRNFHPFEENDIYENALANQTFWLHPKKF